MKANAKTAEEAYALVSRRVNMQGFFGTVPVRSTSAFICPYCTVNSLHNWGILTHLSYITDDSGGRSSRSYDGKALVAATCQNCLKESIFIEGKVIEPYYTIAPEPHEDLPLVCYEDYKEAQNILSRSPRGAAALLRLVIQKLCKELGSKKHNVNDAIGELVSVGTIDKSIQKALDVVRVIGNDAVHPGVIDLKDDVETGKSLFSLINYIVDRVISEPRRVQAIYDALPAAKLAGIEKRDNSEIRLVDPDV